MHASIKFLFCALFAGNACTAVADGGALDATFGSGGKVQLGPNTGFTGPYANDIAVQPDGKIIVVGYETATDGFESWRIARLNTNGSVDTSFASNGMLDWNAGTTGTRAHAVAVRPDGRFVVGGNFENVIEVSQFTADGSPDPAFAGGQGYILLTPPAGDSNYLSRLVIDTDGSIDIVGTYYANQSSFNSNEFFFDRIAADGSSDDPFQYEFGTGANQDDHATDLAIDSQGRYVVVGYHRGVSGDYDFAAIRIRNDLYEVDTTFGSAGQTTVDFGDDGDYCNTLAITRTGYIALGGQASGQAALALLDPDGILYRYYSGGNGYPTIFSFAYGGGGGDAIAKLILDNYDTERPQFLAIGSGMQGGNPSGEMFGVARLNVAPFSGFTLDTSFSSNGTESVYFAERPSGLGGSLMITTNYASSGAFAHGKLVAAGYTVVPGANDEIALTRLAAFDGIFKNSFDTPSY